MKIRKYLLAITCCLVTAFAFSQENLVQNIRGTIVDAESNFPIYGATIVWASTDTMVGTLSDIDGHFILQNIPVGRQDIIIQYLGYKKLQLNSLLLTTGKELELNIKLEEEITEIGEVVITATTNRINDMSTVSSNDIRVDEVIRYAGSMGDVSRMIQTMAGISGAGDDRNDIIVRGNSPSNILWRMNGLDIPSPNHYSTLGTSGGPVSMINTNNLVTSTFLASAFPAEFGNVTGAVFDLRLRNGNSEKIECLGQVSFNGFEAGLEGPLKIGKRASFLINYRYSTLDLVNKLGINFGAGFAVPRYQDLTFKFNIPTEKWGTFSFWGIGGLSNIEFLAEENDMNLYSTGAENLNSGSTTGILGLNHTYFFNPKLSSKLSFLASNTIANTVREEIIDTIPNSPFERSFVSDNGQTKYTVNWTLNYKINAKHTFKAGINYDLYDFEIVDSILLSDKTWFNELEYNGNAQLLRSFVQWKYKFNEKISIVSGVNVQLFDLNNSTSFEPRIGFNYGPNLRSTFGIAYGRHSQLQPVPVYFSKDDDATPQENEMNKNLDFIRSDHFVFSYTQFLAEKWSLITELYFQKLFSIAEDPDNKDFSIINYGADFGFPNKVGLTSTGKAKNYGVELTLKRKLNKGFYSLITASVFNSTYMGENFTERNTFYNSNYVFNFLIGKEFHLNKKLTLILDGRFTYSGGRRYTPILLEESIAAGSEIRDENNVFEAQLAPYIRPDIKLGLRYNTRNITHTFYVDFQNFIGRENEFFKQYDKVEQRIRTQRQRGFFPDVKYQIVF